MCRAEVFIFALLVSDNPVDKFIAHDAAGELRIVRNGHGVKAFRTLDDRIKRIIVEAGVDPVSAFHAVQKRVHNDRISVEISQCLYGSFRILTAIADAPVKAGGHVEVLVNRDHHDAPAMSSIGISVGDLGIASAVADQVRQTAVCLHEVVAFFRRNRSILVHIAGLVPFISGFADLLEIIRVVKINYRQIISDNTDRGSADAGTQKTGDGVVSRAGEDCAQAELVRGAVGAGTNAHRDLVGVLFVHCCKIAGNIFNSYAVADLQSKIVFGDFSRNNPVIGQNRALVAGNAVKLAVKLCGIQEGVAGNIGDRLQDIAVIRDIGNLVAGNHVGKISERHVKINLLTADLFHVDLSRVVHAVDGFKLHMNAGTKGVETLVDRLLNVDYRIRGRGNNEAGVRNLDNRYVSRFGRFGSCIFLLAFSLSFFGVSFGSLGCRFSLVISLSRLGGTVAGCEKRKRKNCRKHHRKYFSHFFLL